jgi:DNA polymerase sigma
MKMDKMMSYYGYVCQKYKKIISQVLKSEGVLLKVDAYGSLTNNFLIDMGDIDICIVPKIPFLEFAVHLEKLKSFIISKV